jgi:hypothetical protein
LAILIVAAVVAALGGRAISAEDKYTLQVPGGLAFSEFEYDAASDTFRPGNLNDEPPQANDAKCGYACHTIVQTKDYVFRDTGTGELRAGLPVRGAQIGRPLDALDLWFMP